MKHVYTRFLCCAMPAFFVCCAMFQEADASTLYDLGSVALDGSGGENTYSLGSASLALGGGNSSLTLTNSSAAFSYFVGYFNQTSLVNVGDRMVLSFTAVYTNFSTSASLAEQALRMGLFSSGGSMLSANSVSTDSSSLNTYTGYRADYNPNSSGTTTTSLLRERTGSSTNLFSTGSSPGLSSSPATDPLLGLTGSPFSGSFTVEKTASGVLLTSIVNGTQTVTASDNASAFTTFDTVGFFIVGDSSVNTASIVFTDLQVALVPEPGTWILVVMAAGPLLFWGRKMKARRS